MPSSLTSYQISSYGMTDTGLVRSNNEDYWDQNPEHNLYVLADGMGGHLSGEIASKEAVCTFLEVMKQAMSVHPLPFSKECAKEITAYAIQQCNWIVHNQSLSKVSLTGMGTTLCSTQFFDRFVTCAYIGDSRIYRIRQGAIKQISRDHSFLREICGSGQLDALEQKNQPYKHLITKAIGLHPTIKPSLSFCGYELEDLFLMCSDGLSDLVPRQEILRICQSVRSLKKIAESLIRKANDHGGTDNITIVLLKVEKR